MKPITIRSAGTVVAVATGLALLGGICGFYLGRNGAEAKAPANEPAPVAAKDFRFENSLLTVERNEWAVYRLPDKKTLYYKVLGRDPGSGKVTIVEEQRDDDLNKLLARRETGLDPNYFLFGFENFNVVRLYPDRITAAGREFDCLCVETLSNKQGLVISWFSNEVPVLGLVKRQRGEMGTHGGLMICEIIDWSGR